MLKKISENSNLVQAFTAIIQTGIALCMLFTLFQNQRMLESSIEPVVDMAMDGSSLRLTNSGNVEIRKLEAIALIAGHFDTGTNKISDYQVGRGHMPMRESVKSGETSSIDLSQFKKPWPNPKPSEIIEVYCLVLRYRRAADMKPFTRLASFSYSKDSETGTIDVYMPLFPSANFGKARTSTAPGTVDFTLLARQELMAIYKNELVSEDE